jgi:hypothetical protein
MTEPLDDDDDTAMYEVCFDEIGALVEQHIQHHRLDPLLYGEVWRACFAEVLASVIRKKSMFPSDMDAYLKFNFDRIHADVTQTVRKWDEHGPALPTP